MNVEIDRKLERATTSLEVLVELAPRLVDRLRGAQHAQPEGARKALDLLVGIGVIHDPRETSIRRGDEECSDRRFDEVVRDVEQIVARCRFAEAAIEFGRNGHCCNSFLRNLRMPADAAWRAAVAFEPSATPMSV